jgi:hypothetical protein
VAGPADEEFGRGRYPIDEHLDATGPLIGGDYMSIAGSCCLCRRPADRFAHRVGPGGREFLSKVVVEGTVADRELGALAFEDGTDRAVPPRFGGLDRRSIACVEGFDQDVDHSRTADAEPPDIALPAQVVALDARPAGLGDLAGERDRLLIGSVRTTDTGVGSLVVGRDDRLRARPSIRASRNADDRRYHRRP